MSPVPVRGPTVAEEFLFQNSPAISQSRSKDSLTYCFVPDFSDFENCSIAGSVATPANIGLVGQGTRDNKGNICETFTATVGFPLSAFPPIVVSEQEIFTKITYDPATGSGDASFTNYTGGKCTGSKFISTGATVVDTGTIHFVFSGNGNREDYILTTLVNPQGSYGAFNLVGFRLKQ